jgi:hypothetical protein
VGRLAQDRINTRFGVSDERVANIGRRKKGRARDLGNDRQDERHQLRILPANNCRKRLITLREQFLRLSFRKIFVSGAVV